MRNFRDPSLDSDHKIALITGGAGGLGPEVVRRFLREGYRVHVPLSVGDDGGRLTAFLRSSPLKAILHPDRDLTDPAAVNGLVDEIRRLEGTSPDILVHLAGAFASAPFEDTDPALWDRIYRANVLTAFLCARAVFPGMREAAWGRILTISAYPAIDRGKAELSAYSSAKAALLNFTQTLAREGAPFGITANALLPSIIDTPGNRAGSSPELTTTWLPPRDIAEVLAFLSSEQARIINGAAIPLTLG
jgi:NAD(P)-dependent dehydrogenase (short-subunit alcohol dehydrogenase family)